MTSLMLVGGFMNAYTFIVRGGIFSTVQTGNMSRVGVELARGNFTEVSQILPAILAAILGSLFATLLQKKYIKSLYRWRQTLLLFQLSFFLIVSIIPNSIPHICITVPFSFLANVQLSAFRTYNGHPCNTTICTGNIRSVGANIAIAISSKGREDIRFAVSYTLIVFSFMLGAFIGTFCSLFAGTYGILFACLPLLFVLLGSAAIKPDLRSV